MASNVVATVGGQVIPPPTPTYIYVQGGTEVVGPIKFLNLLWRFSITIIRIFEF